MKKLIYLFAISIVAMTFHGCNRGIRDAKEKADSLNTAKSTSSKDSIKAENDEAKFATSAADGGMAEVELGKLALTKTSNPDIKEFADMMIKDHGKVNEQLKSIAEVEKIVLPITISEDHQKKLNDLQLKSGADFDKSYVETMIDGHKKMLKLFQDEAKEGKDNELRTFATKTVSTIQTHLDKIQKIHDKMK